MPAFRSRNLRSGDVTEQLGLLLLQSLGLVAAVPRTEDVGIDALFTILEDFDQYRFKASSSFYVQLKSSSVESLEYVGQEVSWLLSLELPFFIGTVNKKKACMELYCCHALSEVTITEPDCKKLILTTENGINITDLRNPGDTIKIGPPVFTWSLADIDAKSKLRSQFNNVCKAHVKIAKISLAQRRIGMAPTVLWKTNEIPQESGWKSMVPNQTTVVEDIAAAVMPSFSMLCDASVANRNVEYLDEIVVLARKYRLLAIALREHDKNPNSKGLILPKQFLSNDPDG